MAQESENINFKIPILHRTVPYVYVKMNNFNNRYRLSCNYRYLNEHYGLKINFIRDLTKLEKLENTFFKITDNTIKLNDLNMLKDLKKVVNQTWELGSDKNTLKIVRLIHDKCTMIIFHRIFENDENYSIFYASKTIPNINTFLKDY